MQAQAHVLLYADPRRAVAVPGPGPGDGDGDGDGVSASGAVGLAGVRAAHGSCPSAAAVVDALESIPA